ncbi:MAG: thiamine-phosphate kinase [Kiritimatiellae bacterium]|nr:thiamine-phosphate kinase [Kiritimatiellia bacterium]
MSTLAKIGELEIIRRLAASIRHRPDVVTGIGDDCAVVHLKQSRTRDILLTTDAVTEGVHFVPETPGRQVGHKAIGRVLSDIAAMGGKPMWALVDIGAPGDCCLERLKDFYRGAIRLAGRHGVSIVGGDTSEAPVLTAHVFGVGTVPTGRAVLRSGARPGDLLFVTGSLGGSILGKHVRFVPRVREGLMIRNWATSMIDLSDGLATDLRHILTMSGVGARLFAEAIPVATAAHRLHDGRSALDHALHDGEDFELLFTIPPERRKAFLAAWRKRFDLRCSEIGIITPGPAHIVLVERSGTWQTLTSRGYEHFSHDKASSHV